MEAVAILVSAGGPKMMGDLISQLIYSHPRTVGGLIVAGIAEGVALVFKVVS